jgi:hypothetical protein
LLFAKKRLISFKTLISEFNYIVVITTYYRNKQISFLF